MKIESFSITRYRSIHTSETIQLGDLTVLVGPNNGGKSNVLNGLVVANSLIENAAGVLRARNSRRFSTAAGVRDSGYNWNRDFPTTLRDHSTGRRTTNFGLTFRLGEAECADFFRQVGNRTNGEIHIDIRIGEDSLATFEVKKKGRGKKSLTQKLPQVLEFISQRMRIETIPAVRTAEHASAALQEMVETDLNRLRSNPDFIRLTAELEELQQAHLAPLQERLTASLKEFLPGIQTMTFELPGSRYLSARPRLRLNDGTHTDLTFKGDGVQSLAALVFRHERVKLLDQGHMIITLEEPEAHLHPGAVRDLKPALAALAIDHQVILTTHSPLLINEQVPSANVIVQGNRAVPALSLKAVRESLGVPVSEHLLAARLVVCCEGASDEKLLALGIAGVDPQLAALIDGGDVVVSSSDTAVDVPRAMRLLDSLGFTCIAVLDGDAEGIKAAETLQSNGFDPSRVWVLHREGLSECEIEDFLDPEVYRARLEAETKIDISHAAFHGPKKKWSDRLEVCARACGTHPDSTVVGLSKRIAREEAIGRGFSAFTDDGQAVMRGLAAAVMKAMGLSQATAGHDATG